MIAAKQTSSVAASVTSGGRSFNRGAPGPPPPSVAPSEPKSVLFTSDVYEIQNLIKKNPELSEVVSRRRGLSLTTPVVVDVNRHTRSPSRIDPAPHVSSVHIIKSTCCPSAYQEFIIVRIIRRVTNMPFQAVCSTAVLYQPPAPSPEYVECHHQNAM